MSDVKFPKWYALFVTLVVLVWIAFMANYDLWYVLQEQLHVIVTMIFGAFVAGSSPEGSASIAYPIFTLYLDISPSVARNFAFAIQSLGMTSASIFILNKHIKVDWLYIKYVSAAGIIGLIIGTYTVAPYVVPLHAKLIFVSLWLGFGIVLYNRNRRSHIDLRNSVAIEGYRDIIILLLLGLVGGLISSIFGTGINIFSFCFVVIYYHLNEKIATPSSVIIMTIETIIGFGLHALILKDITQQSYEMWWSCIPFVIFFAPLGAWVVHKVSRHSFNHFLYVIFAMQYLGAMYVIRPDFWTFTLSFAIILTSIIFFKWVQKRSK
jgi:uncharacterized protein